MRNGAHSLVYGTAAYRCFERVVEVRRRLFIFRQAVPITNVLWEHLSERTFEKCLGLPVCREFTSAVQSHPSVPTKVTTVWKHFHPVKDQSVFRVVHLGLHVSQRLLEDRVISIKCSNPSLALHAKKQVFLQAAKSGLRKPIDHVQFESRGFGVPSTH